MKQAFFQKLWNYQPLILKLQVYIIIKYLT